MNGDVQLISLACYGLCRGLTDKVYDFQTTFAQLRSTDNLEGEVLNTTTISPTLEQIQNAPANFKGIID